MHSMHTILRQESISLITAQHRCQLLQTVLLLLTETLLATSPLARPLVWLPGARATFLHPVWCTDIHQDWFIVCPTVRTSVRPSVRAFRASVRASDLVIRFPRMIRPGPDVDPN